MQDCLTKFVSDPTSPPQLVDIPEEGKGKGKERREVGEGDDEGPIWRTREGAGSEWEPIKILLEGDRDSNKTNTTSNTRL
jgi:hypothetical protein